MFINDLSSLVQIVVPEKTLESPLDRLHGDQTSQTNGNQYFYQEAQSAAIA